MSSYFLCHCWKNRKSAGPLTVNRRTFRSLWESHRVGTCVVAELAALQRVWVHVCSSGLSEAEYSWYWYSYQQVHVLCSLPEKKNSSLVHVRQCLPAAVHERARQAELVQSCSSDNVTEQKHSKLINNESKTPLIETIGQNSQINSQV